MNQSQNVQFILKSVDNLMSKDEHKVWLSTKRGELKIYKEFQSENLDPNMSYIEVERQHNLILDISEYADSNTLDLQLNKLISQVVVRTKQLKNQQYFIELYTSKRALNDRHSQIEWRNDFQFLENQFDLVSSVSVAGEGDYNLVSLSNQGVQNRI